MFCIFDCVSVVSASIFVSSFWWLCPQDRAGGLPSPGTFFVPPSNIPAMPLFSSNISEEHSVLPIVSYHVLK